MLRTVSRNRRSLLVRISLLAIALAVLCATAPQILVHEHDRALAEHGHSHPDGALADADDGDPRATDPGDAPAPPATDDGTGPLHVHDATGVATVFALPAWTAEVPRLSDALAPAAADRLRPDFSPPLHHRPPIA